jgi:hypothetical protein
VTSEWSQQRGNQSDPHESPTLKAFQRDVSHICPETTFGFAFYMGAGFLVLRIVGQGEEASREVLLRRNVHFRDGAKRRINILKSFILSFFSTSVAILGFFFFFLENKRKTRNKRHESHVY